MNKVEISEEEIPPPAWKKRLARFIRSALRIMRHREWNVSVLLCNDHRIRELNRTYRGIDAPTDVLTFRQADATTTGDHRHVGDLVISIDSLERNAFEQGVTTDEELKRLVVHGLLHLSGMDHDDDDPADAMLTLQERMLHALSGRGIL